MGEGGGGGCHLPTTAMMTMIARLSSAAMMGTPAFLKVSREVRGLRKGVTSVKWRGRAYGQHLET